MTILARAVRRLAKARPPRRCDGGKNSELGDAAGEAQPSS